jgi:hypothetical protein
MVFYKEARVCFLEKIPKTVDGKEINLDLHPCPTFVCIRPKNKDPSLEGLKGIIVWRWKAQIIIQPSDQKLK